VRGSGVNPEELIGEKFKRERERRSLSVEEVHQRLHIHPDIVLRIERSNFKSWPGGNIYVKGFLRQYSDFLGLNTAEVVAEYEMMGIPDTAVDFMFGTPKTSNFTTRLWVAWGVVRRHQKLILKAVGVLVVALVLFLAVRSVVRTISSWFGSLRNESASVTQQAPEAQTQKTASLVRIPSPSAPPTTSQTRRSVPLAGISESSAQGQREYLNSPSKNNYPVIGADDPLMLEVATTTDVWIRVTADDKVLFESILRKGEKERWIADRLIQLKMGRPEGVELALNGYLIGKPGGGTAKKVRLTRKGMEQI